MIVADDGRSVAFRVEAADDVKVTIVVDNPTKVHEFTPVVYLQWNYSCPDGAPLKKLITF